MWWLRGRRHCTQCTLLQERRRYGDYTGKDMLMFKEKDMLWLKGKDMLWLKEKDMLWLKGKDMLWRSGKICCD